MKKDNKKGDAESDFRNDKQSIYTREMPKQIYFRNVFN